MLMKMTVLAFVGAIALTFSHSASAVPVDAAAIKAAAITSSAVQQAQYSERHTRHRVVKCYRELIVGPYVCHRFHHW
jgi:hypothetical protein